MLVSALAVLGGVLAPAAQARGAAVPPSCASLPLGPIELQLTSGKLKLERKVGNLCELQGDRGTRRYHTILDIQLEPGSKASYVHIKESGERAHRRNHSTFGEVARKLKVGTEAFFVTSSVTSVPLPPCEAGAELPQLGPDCNPQPTLEKYTAVAWGHYRGTGTPVVVSIGYAAEAGDGSLIHVITLLKELISGKLH